MNQQLTQHLSSEAIIFVNHWINDFSVEITLKTGRKSKLGDYRFLKAQRIHQITINRDLPHDLFFLTLTHEIAHLLTFHRFKKVLPHGLEWKKVFGTLIQESLNCYAIDFQKDVLTHSHNPKATYAKHDLIGRYFNPVNVDLNYLTLNDIAIGDKFKLGVNYYEKIEKRKIRYICKKIANGKLYLVSGKAMIELIKI